MSMFRRRLMIANALKKSGGYINYPGLIAAWDILKEGKDNNHPDREWMRDLTGNGRDIHWINVAYNEEGSGYKDGAMYLDGVDDYGINENMPILTDYTIIVKRKYFDTVGDTKIPMSYSKNTTSATSSVFWFELTDGRCASFGSETKNINIITSEISYQTRNKYNDSIINVGMYTPIEEQTLSLGSTANRYWISMAFYSAYLFDRSLDEQEIKAFIRKYIDKDYVLPSEQTTT